MKNALIGVIAVGVGFLVFTAYRNSKKKCGCKDAAAAATDTAAGTGSTATTATSSSATPATALGADGFSQKW